MKEERGKRINLIVAMTEKGLIGKGNALPWHIPEDLKHFKKTTMKGIVFMGRKTFESIGKPLPGRKNFILSSSPENLSLDIGNNENVFVFNSFKEAEKAASLMEEEFFIIGGASVYKETIKYADRMIISKVKAKYFGDVYFPEYDKSEWLLVSSKEYNDFTLEVYDRKPGCRLA